MKLLKTLGQIIIVLMLWHPFLITENFIGGMIMGLKVKMDTGDQETSETEMPLFATSEDDLDHVQLDDDTVIKIKIKEQEK